MRLENRKGDENGKGIAWWEISLREFGISDMGRQVLFCRRHKICSNDELLKSICVLRAKVLYSGDT